MADDFKRIRDRVAKHCCLDCSKNRALGNRSARHRLDRLDVEQIPAPDVDDVERARQDAREGRGGTIDDILDSR